MHTVHCLVQPAYASAYASPLNEPLFRESRRKIDVEYGCAPTTMSVHFNSIMKLQGEFADRCPLVSTRHPFTPHFLVLTDIHTTQPTPLKSPSTSLHRADEMIGCRHP